MLFFFFVKNVKIPTSFTLFAGFWIVVLNILSLSVHEKQHTNTEFHWCIFLVIHLCFFYFVEKNWAHIIYFCQMLWSFFVCLLCDVLISIFYNFVLLCTQNPNIRKYKVEVFFPGISQLNSHLSVHYIAQLRCIRSIKKVSTYYFWSVHEMMHSETLLIMLFILAMHLLSHRFLLY